MKKCGLIICMATLGFLCSKTALKAAAAEATPWQTYLDKAPVQAEQFAADPLGTLVRLFAAEPVQLLRDTMQQYADVLLFLSLAAGLAFLLQDTADKALLELAAAGGCGVLLWQELDKLAAALCTRMAGWKSYLLGFLPVYSGVLAAGGEWNAGAATNGFLLTVLCFIAQAVTLWLQPLLRSYLAISMACGISSRKSLSEGCTLTGRLLRQAIGWAGKAFAALMSIQRVVTVQLDRSASRLGQLLTGSVPIVGQALSSAADAVLAGMQLLKSTLGIAALLSIGAEFAPLYLGLLVHLFFLSCCGWLAGVTDYLQKNRDMAVSFLQREVPGMTVTVPEGSFLLWIDCSGLNLAHPAEFLLEKARVSVNDGAAFGNAYGQFIRVNFALTRQKLQEALERIRQALDEKA